MMSGLISLTTSARITWPGWASFIAATRGNDKPHPDWQGQGYVQDVLEEGLTRQLTQALEQSPATVFRAADADSRYVSNVKLAATEEQKLNSHFWVQLNADSYQAIHKVLQSLAKPVQDVIGVPWRVVNVRVWRTPPTALAWGPGDWHTDGFPPAVLKLMIYLRGASAELGSTELELADGRTQVVSGPPGTWLIFKNSELRHRGLAPRTDERLLAEVTLTPWWVTDVRPVIAGLNAQYPVVPWQSLHQLRQQVRATIN